MSLHDFQTPQTLHLHIFNDRIMPGVSDVHGDCKTVYRLKTVAVEGLSLVDTNVTIKRQNTASRSLNPHNNWNDIRIKTTKQYEILMRVITTAVLV